MSGRGIYFEGQIILVTDDARVIRRSELQRLYEIAGDMRTLGAALGCSASTISRALGQTAALRNGQAERIESVRAAVERTQEPKRSHEGGNR